MLPHLFQEPSCFLSIRKRMAPKFWPKWLPRSWWRGTLLGVTRTFCKALNYIQDLSILAWTLTYEFCLSFQFVDMSSFSFQLLQFKMAQEFIKPAAGGLLVDVSCGSGLFSRKFAKSRTYSSVIALDFSENMLRQCYEFIKNDESILTA